MHENISEMFDHEAYYLVISKQPPVLWHAKNETQGAVSPNKDA